jgi:hypothetical protein
MTSPIQYPAQPVAKRSTETGQAKVSLDEKSARRIAAGRNLDYLKNLFRQGNKKPLPTKRIAWLRAVEARAKKSFGKSFLFARRDKRLLLCLLLLPLDSERPDSLHIVAHAFEFDKEDQVIIIAHCSGHAVGRVMERVREVDPIAAIAGEILDWTLINMFVESTNPHDFILLPTRTGCFMCKGDHADFEIIIQTWLPDRLLNDAERGALDKLRNEQQLGFCEKLSELG